MNIIFDTENIESIKDNHVVLELDTFNITSKNQIVTAYCVVGNIPLMEFSQLVSNIELHNNLMKNYQQQNWDYCEQAIGELHGKWNGELDSFYVDLLTRINNLKTTDLDITWNGFIER